MRVPDFVAHLLRKGLQLSKESGRLRIRGIQPSADLMETVRERRDEVLAMLEGQKYAVASYAQQRVWFLAQSTGLPQIYNVPVRFGLKPWAQPSVVARCLDEIVRRHEILRTTYTLVGGQVVQRVEAAYAVGFAVLDLSALPPPMACRELEIRREELAREAFDLARGPVWRPVLFRLAGGASELLVCSHHICTDGTSMAIFGRELESLYSVFFEGRPSDLKEVGLQYSDFAAWQRVSLDRPETKESLEALRQNLEGRGQELRLPWDRPRPSSPTFEGGRVARRLQPLTLEALDALQRKQDLTFFQASLGIFAILMAKYSGQSSFVIGCPVDDRTPQGSERALGFFVNTMLVRCELGSDPTAQETLRRIRSSILSALEHRTVPFDLLVELLNPERRLGRQPLFEVMFTAGEPLGHGLVDGDLVRSVEPVASPGSKFDLIASLESAEGTAVVYFDYSRELLDPSTVERIAHHYERLLRSVAEEPERRLSELELVDARERALILTEWSRGPARPGRGATLTELFGEVCRIRSGATALESARTRLTYDELDRRANRLAWRLVEAGVQRESCVGLLMRRSIDAVVAMLAVLKAGGAYLPLDPTYPGARLRFMVENSRASLVLTTAAVLDSVAADLPAQVLDVGRIGPRLPRYPPGVVNDASSTACVMYTSGSTGKPKGVAVTHEGIVRLVHDTDYVELGPGSVVSHTSNISFDAGTFEVWAALLNGGRLVVLPDEILLSGAGFAAETSARGINTALVTTALLNQLAHDAPDCFRGLDFLLFGGEAADAECLRSILAVDPPRFLVNAYGPTENTTISSCWPVERVERRQWTVPIGRPIAGSSMYVLDTSLRLVPAGIEGEICVAGAGLARGYIGEPGRTAECFVPDPNTTEPGRRMYRTGDRGRWRADGAVEFLGRFDDQIKLRGFRVELGELEAALCSHPRVREACAVVRRENGTDRLEAFVASADSGDSALVSELQEHLGANLPRFMVPSRLITLPSLPLTPNGKVDRKALLALAQRPRDDADPVDHSDPKEKILALVWSRVLGVQPIGRSDSFFDLGGHSLAMMQVISKVKEVFDVEVPLPSFYDNPTLESMAAWIRREQTAPLLEVANIVAHREGGFSALPMNSVRDRRPLFCVHSAGGHLVEYRLLAEELEKREIAVLGLQSPGLSADAEDGCGAGLEEMARRYSEAIQAAQPAGPYRLLGYCIGGVIAFEIAQQLRSKNQEVELLAVLEGRPSTSEGGGESDLGLEATLLFGGEFKVLLDRDEVAALADPEARLHHLWGHLRRQAPGRAPKLDFELFRRLFRVYFTNLQAERRYRPVLYQGAIVLLEAQYQRTQASALALWQSLTTSPVRHLELPGNHLTVLRAPYVRVLASRLAEQVGVA